MDRFVGVLQMRHLDTHLVTHYLKVWPQILKPTHIVDELPTIRTVCVPVLWPQVDNL